jgi:NAD(P)-dependent dehydrogenase (short-subunit alcohol dehydrogenase family)
MHMMTEANANMSGKICLVTGANAGIGKATALGLAQLGATVVMVCRNSQKGEVAREEIQAGSGNSHVDLLIADLSSQQSIRQLAREFQQTYTQLHVLVNNAGGSFAQGQVSPDGIEMTLAVNHLASFLLTNLLLDTIKASAPARIVNVSSEMQFRGFINFDDLEGKRKYSIAGAYAQSKLANVLFTYALARRLEGTGVTVNCLHPGVVVTKIWASALPRWLQFLGNIIRLFGVPPEQGALTSIYLASSPEVEGVTSKYFDKCKAIPSAKISYDQAVQERLWTISETLTHIN